MRLLLIEDDDPLASALTEGLREEGFAVDRFATLSAARAAASTTTFDAVVLDRGLPDGDGVALLREWRARCADTPVLLLTARDALDDRLAGLDSGADDYIVKPVALQELVARVRAVVRRARGRPQPVWTHGALTLDPASRQVTWRSQPVELSSREFSLLELLLSHPGQVLSRSRIEESLYDWSSDVGSNTVEVYVHQLRRKIDPGVVKTLRGVGYTIGPVETLS
ncbi:MAG: response regulator [Rhodocyclaceae bacterium]|nr:response regulator [Rhodocyclaceae bacterium]